MRLGMKWKKTLFFLALLPPVLFAGCGIDDEPFLDPVEPSTVVVTSNTSVRAEITGSEKVLLYYKIYISDQSEVGTISASDMSRINTTLSSDYNGILPYTPLNTSTVQTFTPTVFSNRNFYPMIINSSTTLSGSGKELPGSDETFYGKSSIMINFGSQTDPFLSFDGGETGRTLLRSTGGGSFTPLPEDDRRFRNFTELRNSQNRDVALGNGGNYSYCAVYIIKRGINEKTLSPIYSAPTFLAVLRMPERY
jgi:hypothetical protein